jgi:hypothetical protein
MKILVQILVDQPRGWMQQEVPMYVEGMNAILKHAWALKLKLR